MPINVEQEAKRYPKVIDGVAVEFVYEDDISALVPSEGKLISIRLFKKRLIDENFKLMGKEAHFYTVTAFSDGVKVYSKQLRLTSWRSDRFRIGVKRRIGTAILNAVLSLR